MRKAPTVRHSAMVVAEHRTRAPFVVMVPSTVRASIPPIAFEPRTPEVQGIAVDMHHQLSRFPNGIPVERLGLSRAQALQMRARLGTLVDAWDDPEMDVYNDILDDLYPR